MEVPNMRTTVADESLNKGYAFLSALKGMSFLLNRSVIIW